jgi:hypothetical protein
MRSSSVVRACRSALPVGAFLALATLAIVLAAQAQIACTRQIAVSMPDMPGMDMSTMAMPSGGALSLCPIVLALTIAAVLLTLNATVLLLLDPERAAVSRSLAGFVVKLPFATTCAGIFALGAGAVGTMMAIDGNEPTGPAGWLSLLGIVLAATLAAAIIAVGFGRCVIALTRKIVLAFERALCVVDRAFIAYVGPRDRGTALRPSIPVLAACRGLRAPPFVR